MLFRRGQVGPDIETYLDPALSKDIRFLSAGDFAAHLQTYVDLFGRERLLILFYEGVNNDPQAQISKARTHLGLPPRRLAPEGTAKVKDKSAPVVPPGLSKRLSWAKPIVRPLFGMPAFEAVRGLVAREIHYPQLSDDLRIRMQDYYAPSIEALEKMSGQSLAHWHEPLDKTG